MELIFAYISLNPIKTLYKPFTYLYVKLDSLNTLKGRALLSALSRGSV